MSQKLVTFNMNKRAFDKSTFHYGKRLEVKAIISYNYLTFNLNDVGN